MDRPEAASPGGRIRRLWRSLAPLPGGRWLFSRLVGWMAPYSGTMGARVRELEPGRCRVTLRERRRVRNHLGSIHAVALTNLGELTSGLATLTALPAGVRGIVVELESVYEKKARERVTAICRTEVPRIREKVDHRVRAEMFDPAGDRVAVVRATWRLSPSGAG